jgi:hypothetical protein
MPTLPSLLRSLPDAALMAELIRRWPGRRLRIPKRAHIPEVEILAAVIHEMDSHGWTQWRACCRVAPTLDLHRGTIWRIVQGRRKQARCRASGVDPEYGHG